MKNTYIVQLVVLLCGVMFNSCLSNPDTTTDIKFARNPFFSQQNSTFYKYIYSDFDRSSKEELSNKWNLLVDNAEKANSPIILAYFLPSRPNSAGGVRCAVELYNLSDKRFKYAYFDIVPYNSVGDVVNCQVRNVSTTTLQYEGFLSSMDDDIGIWENVWYNSRIKTLMLTKIRIVFEDNSEIVIDDQNIINSITINHDRETYRLFGLSYVE